MSLLDRPAMGSPGGHAALDDLHLSEATAGEQRRGLGRAAIGAADQRGRSARFSWWDRLLGTYRVQPRAGQKGMTIGIRQHREPQRVDRLDGMLLLPFVGQVTDYAINRRQWADASPTSASTAAPDGSA